MTKNNSLSILENREETETGFYVTGQKGSPSPPSLSSQFGCRRGRAEVATAPGAAMLRSHPEGAWGGEESTQPPFTNCCVSKPCPWWISTGDYGQEGTECKERVRRRNYLINYTTMPKAWVINKRK